MTRFYTLLFLALSTTASGSAFQLTDISLSGSRDGFPNEYNGTRMFLEATGEDAAGRQLQLKTIYSVFGLSIGVQHSSQFQLQPAFRQLTLDGVSLTGSTVDLTVTTVPSDPVIQVPDPTQFTLRDLGVDELPPKTFANNTIAEITWGSLNRLSFDIPVNIDLDIQATDGVSTYNMSGMATGNDVVTYGYAISDFAAAYLTDESELDLPIFFSHNVVPDFERLELTPVQNSAVPEPSSLAVWFALLAACVGYWNVRR